MNCHYFEGRVTISPVGNCASLANFLAVVAQMSESEVADTNSHLLVECIYGKYREKFLRMLTDHKLRVVRLILEREGEFFVTSAEPDELTSLKKVAVNLEDDKMVKLEDSHFLDPNLCMATISNDPRGRVFCGL